MQQTIYASTAVTDLDMLAVEEILTIANRENREFHLTGILLYNGKYFLQILEGEAVAVDTLMKNIKKDIRHHNVITIASKEIDKRDFEQWSMGCVNSAEKLQEVIWDESKRSSFNPYEFEYEEAVKIAKRLSYLI